MKAYSINSKAASVKIYSQLLQLSQSSTGYKLKMRLAALVLLAALTMPMIFVGNWRRASAESFAAPLASLPVIAPISAPPEPFVFSSTTSAISSGALSSVTSLGSFAASGYSSAVGFFTAPQIPSEFAGATAVSPASTFLTSFASSFSTFFGLAVSSKAAPAAAAPAAAMLLSQPSASVLFDFDGDGKADIARWRRSYGEWKFRKSTDGTYATTTLGSASSIIAPGNFDGNGTTDFAVFNPGTVANNATWTIKTSATAAAGQPIVFGTPGDKPVVGDYDGDGTSDLALFRPSTSTWWVRNSGSSNITSFQWGAAGDIPVAGNYDGDNKTDYAVYRPSSGSWYVWGSIIGFSSLQWGVATDIPVPADYDGDGKTDKAVYRPSQGVWYIFKSSDNGIRTPVWGNYGDQPVPADYDNDGKADIAVFRPTNGAWFVTRSAAAGYDGWIMGVPDDTAVPSAYVKQVGGEVYSYDFAKTRLSPKNATGGTNLYSRNFSWGTGLVGLPGRAGLDAGFGVSYNSLVWTKSGSAMVFDADKSQAGPGFRFGYSTIEPVYYNGTTFNYLMITPSGAKVEFRQQSGASNTYETADSSYAQLKINGTGNPNDAAEDLPITVTTTDGTQMSYSYIAGAYRCTQIKDANGNFITIGNDEYGLLRTVTDTLGRVITVNYDGDSNPINVRQTWKGNNGGGSDVTHTYATFNYGSQAINTNFGAAINTVYGPQGVVVKVLDSIRFAGGGSTKFDYNSYGQVYKVSNTAADNHTLNYTKTDLETPAANQTDCPRFSQTKNWVENFNQNAQGTEQETITANSYQENQTLAGINEPVTLISVTTPDGVVERSYSLGRTDWTEALPIYSETCTSAACTGADKKRWVNTNWAQDAQTAPYLLNPRQTEVVVSDSISSRKTEIDYYTQSQGSSVALYGLVKEVRSYDVYQNNALLKRATTEYNLDNAYTSRRIIGLPSKTETFGLNKANDQFEQTSKTTYAFDEGDFTDTSLNQNLSSAIQHDNANYGASFIPGRGNLTSTTRWDVTGQSSPVTSSVKYNTTGAVVAQTTPGSDAVNPTRTVKIDYADAFNDNANRNSFAYPTKIYDPAGNFSEVKYRFDTGANVWAKSPAPQNQTDGKTTTRIFDSLGRLQKQVLSNSGAYTRYEYPASQNYSRVFSTVTDTNNNGAADAADEVLAESYFDGAGRIRQSRTELPNGNWSGQKTEYYSTGQVKRQSVPAEVISNWELAGDDAVRGSFLWTSQVYDWKGRVTRQVNTDGTDKLISYDGCGCAGGQVTTVQGELVPRDDQPNTLARKTRKIYADVQGRTFKTEALNWDASVYSTTKTTFNGRDQATLVRQYAGAETSSTFQDSTVLYDGFGRTYKTHKPEQQNGNGTPAYTTYNYNADDSVQSVVDARGAGVIYGYNSRGLVEQISSSVPSGSTIPVAPTVSFAYDNIGNRTNMTDGLGSVSYEYNQLSQLTAETRSFTDSLPSAPSNGFRLEYTYSLSGQLQSYKDPFGQQINYAQDKVGRLTSVTGSTSFGGVTTYASNPQYTAWGGLKGLSYGNNTQMQMTFNNRLQASHYQLTGAGYQQPILSKNYDYNADGQLKYLQDAVDDRFDRLNTYDNLGRPKTAKSGAEARGGTVAAADMTTQLPYRQSYAFDVFNNLTQRDNRHWGVDSWNYQSNNLSYTYQNNRIVDQYNSRQYDADGRLISSYHAEDQGQYTYNAAGLLTKLFVDEEQDANRYYDGNGREAKRKVSEWFVPRTGGAPRWRQRAFAYYIRSTVMGNETITEIDSTGKKVKTFIKAAGAEIAWQKLTTYGSSQEQAVFFEHTDASGLSQRTTDASGAQQTLENRDGAPVEADALGGSVGMQTPYVNDAPDIPDYSDRPLLFFGYESPLMVNGQRLTCSVDGFTSLSGGCQRAFSRLGISADIDFRNSDPMILGQLGIFAVFHPDSGRSAPNLPPVPNGVERVDTVQDAGRWEYYISSVSWNTTQRTQSPEPNPVVSDPKDCYAFANEVETIANGFFVNNNNPLTNHYPHNVNAFMDALASRFTELGNATKTALAALKLSGPNASKEFGTDNFKTDFIDRSESPNQARHAVFGLIQGFVGGGSPAPQLLALVSRGVLGSIVAPSPLQEADARENPNTASGRADAALNGLTVPKGGEITGSGGQLHARNLGDWIRNNLCSPRK